MHAGGHLTDGVQGGGVSLAVAAGATAVCSSLCPFTAALRAPPDTGSAPRTDSPLRAQSPNMACSRHRLRRGALHRISGHRRADRGFRLARSFPSPVLVSGIRFAVRANQDLNACASTRGLLAACLDRQLFAGAIMNFHPQCAVIHSRAATALAACYTNVISENYNRPVHRCVPQVRSCSQAHTHIADQSSR